MTFAQPVHGACCGAWGSNWHRTGVFGAAASQSVDRRLADWLRKVAADTLPPTAPRRTYDFGLKVVGALGAIIVAGTKTAALEICVPSHRDTNHCGRAFRSVRHHHAQRGRHT